MSPAELRDQIGGLPRSRTPKLLGLLSADGHQTGWTGVRRSKGQKKVKTLLMFDVSRDRLGV